MAGPLKRRPPGGIEVPKPPKQELIRPTSDKKISKSIPGALGKRMGKLGVAGSIFDAFDWASWQVKQNRRRNQGYGPEEGGGIL